jgi:hypothetical protein
LNGAFRKAAERVMNRRPRWQQYLQRRHNDQRWHVLTVLILQIIRKSAPIGNRALGIGIGLAHRWLAGRIALRFAGAIVAMGGVFFLWKAISGEPV